jgi:hypothetical protein
VRARKDDKESGVDDMKRVNGSRRDHLGVLRGRPPLDPTVGSPVGSSGLRRVDEIRELLRLVDRGLLSEEELDAQMLAMYGLPSVGGPARRP